MKDQGTSSMNEHVEAAIARVQGGDANSYREVVNAYHLRLRAAVACRCPHGVDADEVAHMAFIKAYMNISKYEAGTEFYVWLWTFARYTLMDYIKKAQRAARNQQKVFEELMSEEVEERLETEAPAQDPKLRALSLCIQKLSKNDQTMLNMRYDRNVPLKHISEMMGKSVTALKYHLFAVRQSLRTCVQRTAPILDQ